MGIDVYLSWEGQTEEEKKAQITGFSVVHGHTGYLREAYHGGPYATKVFLDPSKYWDKENAVPIDPKSLRERLDAAKETVIERAHKVYNYDESDPEQKKYLLAELKSYDDFVALAEEKSSEGKKVYVYVSH